jgi:hypothetical protein
MHRAIHEIGAEYASSRGWSLHEWETSLQARETAVWSTVTDRWPTPAGLLVNGSRIGPTPEQWSPGRGSARPAAND